MEDRLYAVGKGEEFRAAIEKFRKSNKRANAQQVLYDELCRLGAYAEEADEYVNLMVEND